MKVIAIVLGTILVSACSISPTIRETLSCTSAESYAGPPLHAALLPSIFPSAQSPAPSRVALPIDLAALLDARVDEILLRTGLPAVSAAIALPGVGRWTSTRGLAQVTPAETASHATLFYWASVAKSLTAALVLQLIEEGKLHLDDRLARWYPHIPQAELITIRHLLTHTSGLATNALDSLTQIPQTPDGLVIAASQTPNVFCPGIDASYSNTGYLLLGLVIEAIDQEPFHEVLQRRIAGPLGLKHLRALHRNETHPPDLATPHQKRTPMTDPGAWSRIGSGNVIAQADDMLEVWQSLLTGRLLSPETVQRQWAQLYPIEVNDPLYGNQSSMWFGQGVMLTEWVDDQSRHRLWLGHMGGTRTTNSVLLYDPKIKAYAAIAVNSEVSSVAFANALLQVVEAWQTAR